MDESPFGSIGNERKDSLAKLATTKDNIDINIMMTNCAKKKTLNNYYRKNGKIDGLKKGRKV